MQVSVLSLKDKAVLIDKKNLLDILSEAYAHGMKRNIPWRFRHSVVIDTLELKKTPTKSGPVSILNCTCGVPGCTDIDPIQIRHFSEGNENYIEWKVFCPRHNGERLEIAPALFVFHLPQYQKALSS